jgi:pimeloyl-ACP methyl ester carboxylesterase
MRQYESALDDEFRLVAYDLRGHGMSEAPLEPEHYTDEKLWADDVAAIIDELRLDRPVLVGWSYGAFVFCDYVRAYGQDREAAINLVEGAAKLGEAAFGTLIGPGFLDHFAGAATRVSHTSRAAGRSGLRRIGRTRRVSTRAPWNGLVRWSRRTPSTYAAVQPGLLRGAGGDDEERDRAPARRHRAAARPARARERGR